MRDGKALMRCDECGEMWMGCMVSPWSEERGSFRILCLEEQIWQLGLICLLALQRRGAGPSTDMQVPYVGMRSFCAIMGAITVPVVYAIMRESGYPLAVAAFSAGLILFGESNFDSLVVVIESTLPTKTPSPNTRSTTCRNCPLPPTPISRPPFIAPPLHPTPTPTTTPLTPQITAT